MKKGGIRTETWLICAAGVAVIGGLLWLAFAPVDDQIPAEGSVKNRQVIDSADDEDAAVKKPKAPAKANGASEKPGRKSAKPVMTEDEYAHLSVTDRKLVEAVQAAMDTDDHAKIIAAAVAALKSAAAEVRQEAVDALGWVGEDALSELTGCLADADDDVRDSAINHWECALSEVEDPKYRYSTALSVMGVITQEDAIDSISGQFSNAAQDYIDEIDDESKQAERRVEVVQKLYDIIDGKKPICSEKAKVAYEELTGYEWRGAAEAERYLANPDDYDLPEDRDAE